MGVFELITAVKRDRGFTFLQWQYSLGYKLEICMALPVTVLIGFILYTAVKCRRSFEGTSTVRMWERLLSNCNESFRLHYKRLKRIYPASEMKCTDGGESLLVFSKLTWWRTTHTMQRDCASCTINAMICSAAIHSFGWFTQDVTSDCD